MVIMAVWRVGFRATASQLFDSNWHLDSVPSNRAIFLVALEIKEKRDTASLLMNGTLGALEIAIKLDRFSVLMKGLAFSHEILTMKVQFRLTTGHKILFHSFDL